MQPMGGTEILRSNLEKRVNLDEYNVSLKTYFRGPEDIEDGKVNILWNHLDVNQVAIRALQIPEFSNLLDATVYVSNWQLEHTRRTFVEIPLSKSKVIPNAIEPIEYVERQRGRLKMIYTSTPWRGLDVLLSAFIALNRKDVELHIYSSTQIYGDEFFNENDAMFHALYEEARNIPGIVFHGYATNEEVRKALQQSHIFVYPSTFAETSCLSLIEAAAAGCALVTTNLGALPETSCGWTDLVPVQYTHGDLLVKFVIALSKAVDNYWSQHDSDYLRRQSDFFNEHYSWDNRIGAWKNFLTALTKKGQV